MNRNMCRLVLSLAAIALGACERRAAEAPTPANAAAVEAGRALADRIAALSPGQLKIVLFRAIRDAGHACQGINDTARLPDRDGHPAWSARCDRGDGDFLLVLGPDGQLTVARGSASRRAPRSLPQ